MPYVQSAGARLYYEEAGKGTPILFVHEFSGDFRSWELQMQHFSRRYRCIAFNARGYPPSDVPASVSKYSIKHAIDDMAAVLGHLGLRKAHIVGCSMGAASTMNFGFTYPRMAITLTAIGAGSGSPSNPREAARKAEEGARLYEAGLAGALAEVRKMPNRVQLGQKNPRAWDDFCKRFMEHSAQGSANTRRGVQAKRLSLLNQEGKLRALKVPTHMIAGDEDPGALEASVFVKRVCPAARLTVAPATGHLVHNEEPELFNRVTEDFYALVEGGKWKPRAA
jgi:pimeloyl-ACP methyl ester carboxylesterase